MMVVSPVDLEDEVRTQAVATLLDNSAMITETTGSGPMDIDQAPSGTSALPAPVAAEGGPTPTIPLVVAEGHVGHAGSSSKGAPTA